MSIANTLRLLTKATGETPHGGGARIEKGSYDYRMLVRWIEQGMPYGADSDPHVTEIRCVPETQTMTQKAQQQIAVVFVLLLPISISRAKPSVIELVRTSCLSRKFANVIGDRHRFQGNR